MAALFPKTKMPPPPKVTRMPVETDPEIEAAVDRGRRGRLARGGAMGTRLTNQTQGVSGIERTIVGSSGRTLGA